MIRFTPRQQSTTIATFPFFNVTVELQRGGGEERGGEEEERGEEERRKEERRKEERRREERRGPASSLLKFD